MRFIQVIMLDKEFDRYWKFINSEMEKRDQDMIRIAKMYQLKNTWEIFEGMFGLPESFFNTLEYGRNLMDIPYAGTAEFRFIQAVLKG